MEWYSWFPLLIPNPLKLTKYWWNILNWLEFAGVKIDVISYKRNKKNKKKSILAGGVGFGALIYLVEGLKHVFSYTTATWNRLPRCINACTLFPGDTGRVNFKEGTMCLESLKKHPLGFWDFETKSVEFQDHATNKRKEKFQRIKIRSIQSETEEIGKTRFAHFGFHFVSLYDGSSSGHANPKRQSGTHEGVSAEEPDHHG